MGHTKGWPNSQEIDAIAITISTPKIYGGATDANVHIALAGQDFLLDTIGYDDFEQGSTGGYNFNVCMTLGQLRESEIRLYHDNTNSHPGWYCKEVKILIHFKDNSSYRVYKEWPDIGWLAIDKPPYYTLEAILQNDIKDIVKPIFLIENPYKSYPYNYKIQCHCHSTKSDGDDTPYEIEKAYKDKGYSFVCLTDHNRNTRDPYVDNLVHIDSAEDGKSDRHHILALGINKDKLDKSRDKNLDGTDDRASRPCENIQERINYISDIQETISILAHPTGSHSPDGIGFTLDELKVNKGYTAIEICNAAASFPIWSVYSNYDTNNATTESWWDETLKYKKYAIWGFANDDCHNINGIEFNRCWNVVNCNSNFSGFLPYINFIKEFEQNYKDQLDSLSDNKKAEILSKAYYGYHYKALLQQDILNNLKNGNFYSVVRSPKETSNNRKGTTDLGPKLEISVEDKTILVSTDLVDSSIRFIIGNDIENSQYKPQTITKTGKIASYTCSGDELYVRIEIEQERPTGLSDGSKETYVAFSQPIFVQSTKEAKEKDLNRK